MASIQLAWELGADAAECDVRLTKDNRVILFHDKNTRNLTGENYNISETSWKKLGKLTVKLRETNLQQYENVPIPLLKEVLGTIPPGRMLVIEIKSTRELYPEIPCYYLSSFKPDLNKHFDAIVENKLDGVDLRHAIIDRNTVEKCNEAGLDVWCWTVNDPETALKMKNLGVTSVTTDRPKWLKENL